MLAERDEEVKDFKEYNSQLERESESLKQRAKTLDESENRYKEENWNLETKLQELTAQQKEASDREKKLTQSLNAITAEKVTAQRELDETKVTHARLVEEYAAAVRNHDIELGTAKRKIGMAEGERSAMQRRIDDLTGQNQELARAFSTQRARVASMESAPRASDDDFESAADHITPEHSPPQSPIKGTPRHAVLETETMKSSLHHAQRTIQSQRSLLHREKTEKLELKRIIQDLRDDLEKARTDTTESRSHRRSRKKESKEFKKPPGLLGSFRSSKHEVIHDDAEWEDQGDVSPRHTSSPMTMSVSTITVRKQVRELSVPIESIEHDDTANEASESAFETANERATETEDFQTVNEEFSGSDGVETETEGTSRGFGKMTKPPSLPSILSRHSSRHSINSTASTSADEDDLVQMKSPTGTMSSQRSSRFRLSRGIFSRSRQASEEPMMQSSPASFVSSNRETPQPGQSLFAELQEFDGSDDESVGAHSPTRRGRSITPGSIGTPFSPPPPMPTVRRVVMVDSGVMTEPVDIIPARAAIQTPPPHHADIAVEGHGDSIPGSPVSVVAAARSTSMSSVVEGTGELGGRPWLLDEIMDSSRPLSMSYSDAGAQHDPDMEEKLAQFPAPPRLSPILPPTLRISPISSEDIEPREELPPVLSWTSIFKQSVEPVAEPEVPPPDLSWTTIIAENLEPVAEPEIPPPDLSVSRIVSQGLEPVAEPEVPPPDLSLTSIVAENLEPVAEPEIPPPALSLSNILGEHVQPIAEPEVPPPALSLSTVLGEHVEPIAEPDIPPPALSLSAVVGEHVDPVAEPEILPPSLSLSSVLGEHVEPIAEPGIPPPSLSFSTVLREHVEPIAEPEIPLPTLSLSTVFGEHVHPIAEPEIPPPELSLTVMSVEEVTPVAEPEVPQPELTLTSVVAEHLEPVAEPETPVPELSFVALAAEELEPVAEPQTPPPALSFASVHTQTVDPVDEPETPAPELSLSVICGESVEPVAEPEILPVLVVPTPPSLSLSEIQREHVEPVAHRAPDLSISTILGEHIEPIAEPEPEPVIIPVPSLSLSAHSYQHVEPIAEPEVVLPPAPVLTLSTISGEHVEPIVEPEPEPIIPPAPELSFSTILGEHVEPIMEPEPPAPIVPQLSVSAILGEHVEPIAEPEAPLPSIPQLSLSTITREHVEPIAEPETPVPQLNISTIVGEHVEPVAEPKAPVPQLNISSIVGEHVEPIAEPEAPVPQLNMSTIIGEHVEPIAEPEPPVPPMPQLSMTAITREHVEPVSEPEPPVPALSLSAIAGEHVQPAAEPEPVLPEAPTLSISFIQSEHIEPGTPEVPDLALSLIAAQEVEPVAEPEKAIPPAPLNLSTIHAEHCEPREEPQPIPTPIELGFANLSSQQVVPSSEPEPLPPAFALSPIRNENVRPVLEPLPTPPALAMSSISTQGVEPISPVYKVPSLPAFGFSSISSVETEPVVARSPYRDGFILPRDMTSPFMERDLPETPTNRPFGRNKKRDSSPIIAEDETRQSPRDSVEAETPESQRPLKELSANSEARPSRKAPVSTSDQGAQTSLTSDVIDAMFKTRSRPGFSPEKSLSIASFGTPGTTGTTGTVRVYRSQESLGSPRQKGKMLDDGLELTPMRRPSSSTSATNGVQRSMAPPLWPASVLRRPTTPNENNPPTAMRSTPTPRVRGGLYDHLDVHSPTGLTDASRKSSVSSFASELDSRFNMRPGEMGIEGFGPNTDPRMIQAITQTMIGEYLWKYTRKTGRGEMSGNRHRRYFWVHPYTRTLYWSDRDPSSAGKSELKAKSVPIEAVRVVTDDNPMPPGLHRKSLVIIAPGRTVKFTCTTGQRHETWFNALSYLLLRTNNEAVTDIDELGTQITREDVEEFNPQYGRRAANFTRPRGPASLSSYNSRTTRNESPAVGMSMNVPTLTAKTPTGKTPQRPTAGTLSKLSGYWKGSQLSGTFTSRRGRVPSHQDLGIYEASEAHDSAEDLREMIERQDRESDRLENVRACCDGKTTARLLKVCLLTMTQVSMTLARWDMSTSEAVSRTTGTRIRDS